MGEENGKRKRDDRDSTSHKKSKVLQPPPPPKPVSRSILTLAQKGNQNKWKTPNHKEKITAHIEMGKTFDVEDEGIWVTFARGMKKKAIREFKELCDEVRLGVMLVKG